MRFRTKLLEIDAQQWLGNNFAEIQAFAGAAVEWNPAIPDALLIDTIEGKMRASCRDWVVRGIEGEYYSVREDIFNRKYERVDPAMVIYTTAGYVNEWVGPSYKCPSCRGWYAHTNSSCTIDHAGDCCHYGDTPKNKAD